MSLLEAIVLGLVQGLTEFLPVSSSGHLVFIPALLGWESPGIAFDVLLHTGTLVAVLFYFRSDLFGIVSALLTRDPARSAERRMGLLIAIGTVPTLLVALAFGDLFERLFQAPGPVGAFLCVTAALLFASELAHRSRRTRLEALAPWGAALIGFAQGAAIAPGISRSGATMAAGLGLGLDRRQAARFSFLLSVPIIAAATLKTGLEALTGSTTLPTIGASVSGFVVAGLAGYLAIAGLLAYLEKRSLHVFAAYTAVVGVGILLWQYAT